MFTPKPTLIAVMCVLPVACSIGDDTQAPIQLQTGALTCTTPTNGMTINASTTLCGGNFAMGTAAGAAAITIGASNVQVTCNGTRLVGPGPAGPGASPNVAFKIDGKSGVTLLGCSANAFQYGALITNSSAVTLDSVHFDDNYTDPTQNWVQDSVQGGGIRLENVTGSTVKNSTSERNWNGIELRGGSGNTVNNLVADHCSNWGALIAASNNNTISNSDFSWATRSGTDATLQYPTSWYGRDTKDSAGMVVDAAATGNLIQNVNARYGGDGIFIRSIIGACAAGNSLIGNDVSFSNNNGIESWCDNGTFKTNTASSCNYGIWLGGSDNSVVVGNTANSNLIDGISVQVAEDRHSIYQDNTINSNGRAGLFLGGANYQNTNPPFATDSRVWNSSHLLAQRNSFSGNGSFDVFMGNSRSVVLASNSLTASKVVAESGTTADIVTLGNFTNAAGRTPPTAALAKPASVRAGSSVTFDASGSKLGPNGGTLAYNWLIQAAGTLFANGLPSPFFAGSGSSKKSYTFTSPGFYDVDVTVTDGLLGSLATQNIAVAPGGTRVGETAASWTFACAPGDTSCANTTFVDDPAGLEGSAVHCSTGAAFDFAMVTPPAKNLNLNASSATKFGFFLKANDPSPAGWQAGPNIVIGSPSGTISYVPAQILLPTSTSTGWIFVEVPLAGGNGWTRTNNGGSLSQVNWVEIHADTWDAGFDIWVDAVSFY
jgi:parallel beta-helix repeat protein